MTRALFRKQMMEVFSWLYKNQKTGKFRTLGGTVAYSLMYLAIFVGLGAIFFMLGKMLCEPLLSVDMGWLYWCLMGLVGVFLGVFGSAFNTYSALYQAKDNDLLLSMPIPNSRILLIRLSGVYAMGLMYELIVMIPTLLVWFMTAQVSVVGVVCAVLVPFILSVFVLVLSAILGWVVALVVGKLKSKNIITVLLSLGFIGAYYYIYGKAYSMIQEILLHAEAIGGKMKGGLNPLYHMGLGAAGNVPSLLIFTAMVGVMFSLVYLVMSRSFLRLVTTSQGGRKTAYREKKTHVRSVKGALLHKELLRFTGSANYMLNCGLGILFMPVAAVLLLWKQDVIREVLAELPLAGGVPALIAAGAVCLMVTMNDMVAPSVSLEGKNLWVAQSLPVSGSQVLGAKLRMQLLLTLIPAAMPIGAVEWVLRPGIPYCVMIPVTVVLFAVLMAGIGLGANLKMPNLSWTSEIVPIKQSASVMLALFGGWLLVAGAVGLYLLLDEFLSPMGYFLLICGVLLVADLLILGWLYYRGGEIFERM